MKQRNSKTKDLVERCGVCERDIHRIGLANHLKTEGHLLEKPEKTSDFCSLVVEAAEFERQFFTDRQNLNRKDGIAK